MVSRSRSIGCRAHFVGPTQGGTTENPYTFFISFLSRLSRTFMQFRPMIAEKCWLPSPCGTAAWQLRRGEAMDVIVIGIAAVFLGLSVAYVRLCDGL